MNYFECEKCKVSYIYNGNHIPFMCGAFVGYAEAVSPFSALGCGGKIIQITKEEADRKVDLLRS